SGSTATLSEAMADVKPKFRKLRAEHLETTGGRIGPALTLDAAEHLAGSAGGWFRASLSQWSKVLMDCCTERTLRPWLEYLCRDGHLQRRGSPQHPKGCEYRVAPPKIIGASSAENHRSTPQKSSEHSAENHRSTPPKIGGPRDDRAIYTRARSGDIRE